MYQQNHRLPPLTCSRRSLLKTACIATGVLAATSLSPYGALAAPTNVRRPLKIGVLIPQSRVYPRMGRHLLAGIRLYLQQHDNQIAGRMVDLVVEDTGFSSQRVVDGTYKLINTEEADLLVGIVQAGQASPLHEVLEQSQTFLIATTIAANIATRKPQSPYVFHNSLNYWQSNWAMGQWAAQHLGKQTVIATSLYDAGYDTLAAFRLGFESAGGTILDTRLFDMPGMVYNPLPHFASIRETSPDFVYALFSRQRAMEFLQDYAASDLAGRIPLAGAGFTVEDELLSSHGQAATGIKSVMPWILSLDNAENQAFAANYRQQNNRDADAFALLGYDTAHMVAQTVEAVDGDLTRVKRVSDTLSDITFASPRGQVRMNADTGILESPLYLCEVQQHGATLHNAVIQELDSISELDEHLAMVKPLIMSGWLNPYLAV